VSTPLLEVTDLSVRFAVRRGLLARAAGQVRAVEGVSFSLDAGRSLGLVGESGCGKSTTGRAILRLVEPSGGTVRLSGEDLGRLSPAALRRLRPRMQMIFQDPYASLDPRMTVQSIVAEPLRTHRAERGRAKLAARVGGLLERVGLDRSYGRRYPHELSGGQRQRVGIARAIALEPALIVADEPVSALDMSVRAQIINLLVELQRQSDVAYLFIAHDLAVVRYICDEVAVMYLGRIVEHAPTKRLFSTPAHPYTQALMAAVLTPDPRRERNRRRVPLIGEVPSPLDPPSGCAFHTRCPHAFARCHEQLPELRQHAEQHRLACHLDQPPEPEWS